MPVRLILSDIDQTILPKGDPVVPQVTRDAFREAIAAGLRVGPATGRALEWVDQLFGGDKACFQTCVATNGNQVRLDGRQVREARITPQQMQSILDALDGVEGSGIIYFDGKQPVLAAGELADLMACFAAYGRVCRTTEGGHALGIPDEPKVKANVFVARGDAPADEATTREVVAHLNEAVEGLDFDFPQLGYSNVMPHGWSKASGIEALVEELGISWDEVVVFGDAGNDLAMFDKVPNSVAVANATPEAAEAARWHIGACRDNAVADAILALARGEWPFER